jgi:hypothetical protein
VDVTYSTVTPTIDQVVTMTSPDPLIDLVVDSIIFQGQIPGSREGDPQNLVPSADSSSVQFNAPPNINGLATVVNFHFPGGYLRALPTRDTVIASPNIGTTIEATFDDTLPALLQPVTLTAPPGFSFDDTTNVTIGGNLAITQSVTGSSVTVLPIPGSVGVASIDGVVPDVAPNNIVTMLSIQSIVVPPLFPLEGTDDPATAPLIPTPGTTVDAGTFAATNCPGFTDVTPIAYHCQVYRISFAAPSTFTYTLTGANAADLGLYFYNAADLSPRAEFCDAEFNAAPPESCPLTFPAGEYIMAVINFGPAYDPPDADPPFIEVRIE